MDMLVRMTTTLHPMTINGALRKLGRPTRSPKAAKPLEPLAVGEVQQRTFNCPTCARPLAIGAPICLGCGTRLLFGVKARIAGGFVLVGLVVGVLLGGGLAYLGSQGSGPGPGPGVADLGPTASHPPAASGAVVSPPPVKPADVGIPSGAVSAMRQAAILDARLAAETAQLRGLLHRKSTQPIDIARVLRSLNTDATFGVDLAPAIAPWSAAAAYSNDLGAFYRAVRDSSVAGLRPTLSDAAAYRAAGFRMSTLLAKLPPLRATAAGIVAAAGLAPLVPPTPAPSAVPASAVPASATPASAAP